jgi:glycosyltransferase involved in cell wall biosynthesis
MNMGGPALQIVGISQHLDGERFEQLLLTGFCDNNELDLLLEKDLEMNVIRVQGLGREIGLFQDLKALLLIRKFMKEFKPDIVHTHTAKAGVLGRIASLTLLAEHKRVHTFHGHLLHGYFSRFVTKLVVVVERTLALKTDILVCVGREVRDDLVKSGIAPKRKFRVIPPGLELEELPSKLSARKRLGLQAEAIYVAWIGRIVPVKRPERLLEIAEGLLAYDLNVRFCVAGEGELYTSLTHEAERRTLPIDFLGWRSNIEEVLAASDFVVLTSTNEGTPLSLIQAQMAGKPVVATRVGSVHEIVLDQVSGYVDTYETEKFISHIVHLARNESLRETMGASGKKFAEENFSVHRLTEDHQNLYASLLL